MTFALPAFLEPYKVEIFMVLLFVDGLLIGLAIRKGATALVYGIIAFAIASFLGIIFFPNISFTTMYDAISNYVSGIKLGIVYLGSSIVVFAVGIVLGLLKK